VQNISDFVKERAGGGGTSSLKMKWNRKQLFPWHIQHKNLSFVQIDHKKKIKSITPVSLKIKVLAFINTLEFHFELFDQSNIDVWLSLMFK
jgi:hypothetical protein